MVMTYPEVLVKEGKRKFQWWEQCRSSRVPLDLGSWQREPWAGGTTGAVLEGSQGQRSRGWAGPAATS